MKVWIIYDNKFEATKRYCVDAMLDAAKRNNVDAEVLFPIYFTSIFENGKVKLLYKNKVIDNLPDYVLFRIYDNELLQTFEKLGVKIINGGMMQSKNKYISTIFASHLNMNIPKTIYTKNYDYDYISSLLGSTFIMKDNFGAKGTDVYLIKNKDEFEKVKNNADFIFQEFIEKSAGKDTRLYVIENKVVGCIERYSENGDFRSNVAVGGKCREIDVPKEIKNQAVELSKAMNIPICSVDFLFDQEKYYFCETNANAGFTIYAYGENNMQDKIMQYISKLK